MGRSRQHAGCGGKVQALYYRQSNPQRWVPFGKVCIQCWARPSDDELEPTPGPGVAGIRFRVLERDGFRCQYCGRSPKEGAVLHVDHVHPRSQGGRYEESNLLTACFECNVGKGDVLLKEPPPTATTPDSHQADTTPDVQISNLARGTQEAATPDIYEKMSHNLVPPLDAQGLPPDSAKGKAAIAAQMKADPEFMRGVRKGLKDRKEGRMRPWSEVKEELGLSEEPAVDKRKPSCTCGPGEKVKGKHNKKCPARG